MYHVYWVKAVGVIFLSIYGVKLIFMQYQELQPFDCEILKSYWQVYIAC
jgi:hypothetical protein